MHLLKKLYSRWKTIAHHLGIFQSKVILTLFYFILLLPFGIIFSLFKDELGVKTAQKSTWTRKKNQSMSIAELKEQF